MKFILSALGALILEIVPLPLWAMYLRPEFLLIVMIYWALAMPYRIGLGTVWLFGLVADLLHSNLLGERALFVTLIVFLVIKLQARIRLFPMRQQMLVVFLLVLLFKLMQMLVLFVFNGVILPYTYWLAAFTSALCWPLLLYILGYYQHSLFTRD